MLIDIEHYFSCQYCGASISMVLDLSAGKQEYIEDCEVCCRPLEISFNTDGTQLLDFSVSAVEQ